MGAVTELASKVGTRAACQALRMPRASYYRDRRKTFSPAETASRPSPSRSLGPAEQETVLARLHEERFQDRSPAAVYATLLDEGEYLCSIRSMYRLLRRNGRPVNVAISWPTRPTRNQNCWLRLPTNSGVGTLVCRSKQHRR
jgi:putative transposase